MTDYTLNRLFPSEAKLTLKLQIAQYRILEAFDDATHWSRGKVQSTDNFIVQIGGDKEDLVRYVYDRIVTDLQHRIVLVNDLPEEIEEPRSVLQQIAESAEKRLLAMQASLLAESHDIWFDHSKHGTWNVRQGLMADYRRNRQIAREIQRIDETFRRESLHGGGRLMVVH